MRSAVVVVLKPAEPIFLPKVDSRGQRVLFEVPPAFLTSRYRGLVGSLTEHWGHSPAAAVRRVPVADLEQPVLEALQALQPPAGLPRHSAFSTYIPEHRKMATRLMEIFMGSNVEYFPSQKY